MSYSLITSFGIFLYSTFEQLRAKINDSWCLKETGYRNFAVWKNIIYPLTPEQASVFYKCAKDRGCFITNLKEYEKTSGISCKIKSNIYTGKQYLR